MHTHCVAATYFIYYKMVYTTPPGKSKGRWNFDTNDIYDITPSTIIGLLVRHHRKTKMETHGSLVFFIQPFPNKQFHSSKPTWQAGKSPFSIGNTSSKGPLSIAMVIYLWESTQVPTEAKFHPQLWQCFIDQTWPDKVGHGGWKGRR